MTLYNRRKRIALDQLVEEYTQKGLGRRIFLQRAMAVGLTASSASALLAACGGSTSTTNSVPTATSVDILNVWSDEEQASFKAVTDPFKASQKISVTVEATRDLDAELTTRIRANNLPDIAILPNPGKMRQLVQQKKLIKLDTFLDMNALKTNYAQSWTDIATVDGNLYALFYKVANKGTVWYNPSQFHSAGYTIPTTWSEMITLSDKIAQSGKYPWTMGVESGSSSGWPAADWLAEIYLKQFGPDMYDKWVNHQIPWTHDSIKTAFQTFGKIVGGNHYINGAPQSILAAGFTQASYGPFSNPPTSYMYYLGDFAEGFITTQYPQAKAGSDFDYFPFPTINEQYKGGVTGGADVIVALKDTTAVRALIQYLATAQAQSIWVKRGGFVSPNKQVSLADYPNDVERKTAQMLTASGSIFRFGADDLMPSEVENDFWKGMLTFIGDQSQLDSVLSTIEATAQQAYTS
jgi:alpha-glucoside transport system substrate-binding protein